MFYFIYLFSSLILICNNFAESNEDGRKIKWACVNAKCDSPISEFVTNTKMSLVDHKEKLMYEIKAKGTVLKKPKDNFEYYFAQIGDKQGYIKKDYIREGRIFDKNPQFTVDGYDPFEIVNDEPIGANKIKPSQPMVVDGTTLYNNEINESDEPKVFIPPNSVETTPLNHNGTYNGLDIKTESTRSDSVDTNLGKQTGKEGTEDKPPLTSENERYQVSRPDILSNSVPSESGESEIGGNDSKEDSAGSVGVGSSTPVDNFDDEVDIEEDDEDLEDDEEMSDEQTFNQNEEYDSYLPSKSFLDTIKKETQSDPVAQNHDDVNKPSSLKDDLTDKTDTDVTPKDIPVNTDTDFRPKDTPVNTDTDITPDTPVNTDTIVEQPSQLDVDKPQVISHPQLPPGYRDSLKHGTPFYPHQVDSGHSAEVKDTVDRKDDVVTTESNNVLVNTSDSASEQISDTLTSNDKFNTSLDANEADVYDNTTQVDISSSSNEQNDVSKSTKEEVNISVSMNENDIPKDTNERKDNENIAQEVSNTEKDSISNETSALINEESIKVEDNQKDDNESNPPETSSFDQQVTQTPELTQKESNDETSQSIDDYTPNIPSDENVENTTPSTQEPKNEQIITDTFNENLVQVESQPEDSAPFYAPLLSLYSSFFELFNKSELNVDRTYKPLEENSAEDISMLPSIAPSGYCRDAEECRGLERPLAGEDQYSSRSNLCQSNADKFPSSIPLSFNSIIYICITSLVILLFSLGYYYIDKSQNSSSLVAKVNQLSQELFVTKKERDTLEDQLLKVKENCNMMDSSKLKQDSKLTSLQKDFDESESERVQLEDTVARLEKEVETLMDQGMEMHKLLSETITEEERSQMLLANIDELKESLSEKLNEIVTLTNQLDKKNEEIQLSQIDIRNANDRINDLERKLESRKVESEESFTKKLHDQRQQNVKLQKLVEEKGVSIAKLENELAKTKVERDSAEARASSAETGLQSAHSVGAGEARQAWLDATSVRAALATSNKQNQTLQQHLNEIDANNQILQDKISSLSEELSDLNLKYESVEKEKVNALTKLQVLSDYFKEKETKLQEELGVKESQWLQKETEDHTIYEQMKSLREEIASYKAQNDKLKAEILEQEASYKVQIANEEQKSYDNWVALRQTERKAKELQMESAHFRNRLTQLETANNQSSVEALNPNGLDKSSFSAPSPPFMMLPPPPTDFFALPPPPINPSASRPPPLGRISSPQLSGEMIPPPPLVQYEMYPPQSSTPPPPFPIYKPQPRDRPPPPKDSPPSTYSSESVNDKTNRRRRR